VRSYATEDDRLEWAQGIVGAFRTDLVRGLREEHASSRLTAMIQVALGNAYAAGRLSAASTSEQPPMRLNVSWETTDDHPRGVPVITDDLGRRMPNTTMVNVKWDDLVRLTIDLCADGDAVSIGPDKRTPEVSA
jgi:hypothetical protein